MAESNIAFTQTGDYIPRKDGFFAEWCRAFAKEVAKNPEALGLTAEDSVSISLWAGRYIEAFEVVEKPSLRNVGSVRHKKNIRRQVEGVMRMYAQKVKHTPGVTSDQLKLLGVHVDNAARQKVGPPVTAPSVFIVGSPQPGVHVLRYLDQRTFSGAKPHGVAYLQLYAAVGVGRINDVNYAEHVGDYTRQPIRVWWQPKLVGKTAAYFGRWCNRKGEPGPWSLPIAMTITGVGPSVSEPGLTKEEWLATRKHIAMNQQAA